MLAWGIFGLIICLIVLGVALSIVQVEEPGFYLVKRFGKFVRIMRSGINFHWPLIETFIKVSQNIHTTEKFEPKLQTKDDKERFPVFDIVWRLALLDDDATHIESYKNSSGKWETRTVRGKEINKRRMKQFFKAAVKPDGTVDYTEINNTIKEVSEALFAQVLRSLNFDEIQDHKALVSKLIVKFVRSLMNEENNALDFMNGEHKKLVELYERINNETDPSKKRVMLKEYNVRYALRIDEDIVDANTSVTELVGVTIDRINMTDLDPNPEVLKQINDAQVATEAIKAAEAVGIAEQKKAEGEAKAVEIRAAAEAKSIEVRGKAAANARAADLEALNNAGISATGSAMVQAASEIAKVFKK